MKFLTLPLTKENQPTNKKKEKKERSKNNQSNFKKFIFKTSAKLPLVK